MYSIKDLDRSLTYIHTAFITLRGFIPYWRKNVHTLRSYPRALYEYVTSVGIKKHDKSGLTSELYPEFNLGTYIDSKGKIQNDRMVDDHFLSPQTVGEFVLDNPDPYLEDFDLFVRLFKCISSTHLIKKTENDSLSKLKHKIPTRLKYQHKGILLYNSVTKEQVSNIIEPLVYVSDTFFDEYCEWEKHYVLNMDSEYGEPLPEEVLFAQKPNSSTSLTSWFN